MAKKTATKKQPVQGPGPVIYIGPNLPGGRMSAFTVYKNGLPAYVEQLKTETPEIGRLIVPVRNLAQARQRLARHGAEAKAYQAVAKKFNL
jgi:hypothetical protein